MFTIIFSILYFTICCSCTYFLCKYYIAKIHFLRKVFL